MTTRRLDALTERQRQVIALAADGRTYDGIAHERGIGRDAVKEHLEGAADRLGVACSRPLVRLAALYVVWTERETGVGR